MCIRDSLYTYQMSEIIRDEIQQGVEIDGETQEFAFDPVSYTHLDVYKRQG